jgi:hypothetical protein
VAGKLAVDQQNASRKTSATRTTHARFRRAGGVAERADVEEVVGVPAAGGTVGDAQQLCVGREAHP